MAAAAAAEAQQPWSTGANWRDGDDGRNGGGGARTGCEVGRIGGWRRARRRVEGAVSSDARATAHWHTGPFGFLFPSVFFNFRRPQLCVKLCACKGAGGVPLPLEARRGLSHPHQVE